MKNIPFLIALLFLITSCVEKEKIQGDILFDFDWKFALNDQPGAENPGFDDSNWRVLDVPHDFSIEQPFLEDNPSGPGGGYAFGGIGWYRKSFIPPTETKNKRVTVRFEGVYRNSDVWINGHHLGFRPYGYSTFSYDITPYLNPAGEPNLLAVKVNTSDQPNSRWYTGAGIYRHVWLHISDPTHIVENGVYIQTEKIENNIAGLVVTAEMKLPEADMRQFSVKSEIRDKQGKLVATVTDHLDKGNNGFSVLSQNFEIENPVLWSVNNPYLYSFTCSLMSGDKELDSYTTKYGIRTIKFDPEKGFFLNGKHVKLKGVNNHHDGGPLGAACLNATFERQLQILKSMGCNALRMSHNPPAPGLLNCADSMGFLVINEIFDEWKNGKRPYGYAPYFDEWYRQDIAAWIRRDRNHPSVMAWSLGNEVYEQTMDISTEVLTLLMDEARKYDSSRPFTSACNEIPADNASGFAQKLDIVGYNYREPHYAPDHKTWPERVIYGSETVMYPYHRLEKGFPLMEYEDWLIGQLEDFVAGEFLWTGFDYLGESGIGAGGYGLNPWNEWPHWPWRSAVCGVVDLCGFPKPGYWFRKALWTDEPIVYIAVQTDSTARNRELCPFWGWPEVLPHWNHGIEGDTLAVHVYTNVPDVELFVNGKTMGQKHWDIRQEAFLMWEVPYENRTVKALGISADGDTVRYVIGTAGKPASLALIPGKKSLKPNRQDLAYVEVQVLDENGVLVPFAENRINFQVEGEGFLRAVGNGNPVSHTPFNGHSIETFHGKCLAIVQSASIEGTIRLTARCEGLEPAVCTIEVK
ncbi:MAG: DUF4982 domain-containing protein [Prolixibacteraceae bacterium]|nr:DUF4982 domain-containing protein [Prolixibacteraceae bacterium]